MPNSVMTSLTLEKIQPLNSERDDSALAGLLKYKLGITDDQLKVIREIVREHG